MAELVTVDYQGDRRWGIVDYDRVRLAPRAVARSLQEFIDSGQRLPDTSAWPSAPVQETRFVAPIPEPRRNLICLGLNYADHAAEVQGVDPADVELPEHPMFFTKATTTVTGADADIVLDDRVTQCLDWEVELGVIIGRKGRFIAAADAMDHVFGYTVVNDLSAREIQKRHSQFFLGKSMDGSAPVGPWVVTADAVADPHALDLHTSVNGVAKQSSNTRQLIWGIPAIIEILSRVMTLLPGDIIATGTPGGVGFVREPREFLKPGDAVECSIAGIGTIRNRLVGPADLPNASA